MKWFKHENTFNNPKIERLTDKYGLEGYGFYFMIIEILSENIHDDNIEEWGFLPTEYTDEFLAKKLRISVEKFIEIRDFCYTLNLFIKKNDVLYCGKMSERSDDYISRIRRRLKSKRHRKKSTNLVRTKYEESTTLEEEKEEDKEKKKEKNTDTVCRSVNYLQNIPDSDLPSLIDGLRATKEQVKSKAEELYNYCQMHGKSYRNYKLFLRNALKRDFASQGDNLHGYKLRTNV